MKVPKGGWKLGVHSFTKMICYWKDGKPRLRYSIDWKHRYSRVRDREIGLKRFRNKVQEYGARADTIVIYDLETGELLEKYYEGVERPINKHEKRKV